MAVLKKIRARWWPVGSRPAENGAPSSDTIYSDSSEYRIDVMTIAHLDACWLLDQRCFVDGEAYSRDTIEYLLTSSDAICFHASSASNAMVGFVIGLIEPDRTGHITTVCVAPEYRRRGVALRLMERTEEALRRRHIRTIRLEVRSSNEGAQALYESLGYTGLQRLPQYYSNGGDGLLMVKTL